MIWGGSPNDITIIAAAANTAVVNVAFDASDPHFLAIAERLVAEIERQATGFRVRILDAGAISIRVEIYDELHQKVRDFEEQVKHLQSQLLFAAEHINSFREMILEKERTIDKLILRAARGYTEPDSEKIAAVLFLDVAGSATIEQAQKEELFSLLWVSAKMFSSELGPYMCNSWGDAVILALEDPNAALRCAFGLIKTLGAHGYRARAALTFGRVKLIHNPLRNRLDIIATSVDEAARLEPAMKQLDGVAVLASESFRYRLEIDEVRFGFMERRVMLEKSFGQLHGGDRLQCFEVIDKRNE